jgi:HupE / UreJ protein
MTARLLSVALVLIVFSAMGSAGAHELRPGYLEISESQAETFQVLWKVPARAEMRLAIHARFPENCKSTPDATTFFAAESYNERSTIICQGGLAGRSIAIDGLSATMTDVLMRMVSADGHTQVARLTPAVPTYVVAAAPTRLQVARTYAGLGIEHILTGIDHLLFVLALLIITRSGWKMVKTVTAFTISHSITLTAAVLGFVHVPQRPVEAIIGLSVVFVAVEIVHGRSGHEGVTARTPWVVAFTFGLLHGLGFAGGLSEAGVPQGHLPAALLFFSIGVEAGHFAFISVVLALAAVARRLRLPWVPLAPAYAIGSVAMFWVMQRISSF